MSITLPCSLGNYFMQKSLSCCVHSNIRINFRWLTLHFSTIIERKKTKVRNAFWILEALACNPYTIIGMQQKENGLKSSLQENGKVGSRTRWSKERKGAQIFQF